MTTPDYNHLYVELGLQPDCGVDELRQAYRRHVASLHPDRAQARARAAGTLPLSELNALYDEALRFHLHYGRLPGASQARAPRPVAGAPLPHAATGAPATDGSRHIWWALLLAALAAGLVFGLPDANPPRRGHAHAAAADAARAGDADAIHPPTLAVGMDAATVLAIQGEPVRRSGAEWTYGPSWLRFERGRLVDWYSSRLYPLRTDTATPEPRR